MSAPKVFISYSHDSDGHKKWVRHLATDLRANGVDVSLDQWDLELGQDVVEFMRRGITESDRVTFVNDVKRLTSPLFMPFDFTEFADKINTDIVQKLMQGTVS